MNWTKKNYLATDEVKMEVQALRNPMKTLLISENSTARQSATYEYVFFAKSGVLTLEGEIVSQNPVVSVALDSLPVISIESKLLCVYMEARGGMHTLTITIEHELGHDGFCLKMTGLNLVGFSNFMRISGYMDRENMLDVYAEQQGDLVIKHTVDNGVDSIEQLQYKAYDVKRKYEDGVLDGEVYAYQPIASTELYVNVGGDSILVDSNVESFAIMQTHRYKAFVAYIKNDDLNTDGNGLRFFFIDNEDVSALSNTTLKALDVRSAVCGEVLMYEDMEGVWFGLEGRSFSPQLEGQFVRLSVSPLSGELVFAQKKLAQGVPSCYVDDEEIYYFYSANRTIYKKHNQSLSIVAYAEYLHPLANGTLSVWGNNNVVKMEMIV